MSFPFGFIGVAQTVAGIGVPPDLEADEAGADGGQDCQRDQRRHWP